MTHFKDTYQVTSSGHFSVKLPKISNPPELGTSRPTAVRRYMQNEHSLRRKGSLSQFETVLCKYLVLDHAELVRPAEVIHPTTQAYYLPTHGVVKESSTSTKLRAVFDASAKSSSGNSLNDQLLSGPNLYPLLTSILHKFRTYPVAMSSDISKMFREILLDASERDLHRFLVHLENGKLIDDCRMKRLTFGVKCSPYLASQVLRQLADLKENGFPLAANVIRTSFYVDDCLTGAATVEDASNLRQQLCDLLTTAGMTLRKWRSNSSAFIESVPEQLRESADLHIQDPLSSSKALGIHWNVQTDQLHIEVPKIPNDVPITKRLIASMTAKVDVLGLFTPAIIPAKLLLQHLWSLHLDWDTPVPEEVASAWNTWTSTLPLLATHAIDRQTVPLDLPVVSQHLHGFSEASSLAYGAYLRTVYWNSETSIVLVASKARVAPLRPIMIPRLELTAAYLLAKLLASISLDFSIPAVNVHAWTDSTITLSWIRKSPSSLKTFVANRVTAIQDIVAPSYWRHVSSKENPADLASRGISLQELVSSHLWWEGPAWLKLPPMDWPHLDINAGNDLPELRVTVSSAQPLSENPLWSRYSSFLHLTRVLSWIYRFISNIRLSQCKRQFSPILTSEECSKTRTYLFQQTQTEHTLTSSQFFVLERLCLSITPWQRWNMNKNQLLYVEGRVRDDKCPRQPRALLLLSLKSALTKLYIRTLHAQYNHPSVSTLLAIVAEDRHV